MTADRTLGELRDRLAITDHSSHRVLESGPGHDRRLTRILVAPATPRRLGQ